MPMQEESHMATITTTSHTTAAGTTLRIAVNGEEFRLMNATSDAAPDLPPSLRPLTRQEFERGMAELRMTALAYTCGLMLALLAAHAALH